jgi:hypothetical protein
VKLTDGNMPSGPSGERPASGRAADMTFVTASMGDSPHSFGEDIGETMDRLIDTGREFVEAEIGWAKARGFYALAAARNIALLAAIALVIVFGMIVTLMLGTVMALTPVIGIGLALLAVTVAALVAILLCGLGIRVYVRRITAMPR